MFSKQYNASDKIKNFAYWILFIIFWFTAGLRYETGTDYFTYNELYVNTNTLIEAFKYNGIYSSFGNAEFGYMFISSLFRTLGVDINIMFFVIAFVTSLLLFKSIEDYIPEYKFISVLIYYSFVFFILDMSGVRQAVSCSFFLYSLRFLYDKKIYKYYLWIFLAILFHYSAIIALPLYFILNKKISSYVIFLMILVSTFVIILKIPIVELLIQHIVAKIIPGADIVYKLLFYTSENGMMLSWGFNAKVLLNILILIVIVINRDELTEKHPYFNIVLNLFFIYVFIRGLLWESADLNSRINYYFIPGLYLGLPLLMSVFKLNSNKLILFFFIISFNFYQSSTWLLGSPLTTSYNPYQNYFVYKFLDLQSDGKTRNYLQSQIEVKH